MKYLSVCSGVEAATLAWKDIGWEAGAFSEIEPFPSEVLKYHYPQVCNLGDMTKIKKEDIYGKYALLVGGTPCQSFSTAGTRTGLNGLSGLALEYVRLAYEGGFRWIVWENVPGVFSCNGGRDFQTFLSELAGRNIPLPTGGWKSAGIVKTNRKDRFGLAWRLLDAQFTRTPNFPFAVPQRRRRVFVVGYFGDWRPAVQVLFDPKGMCWNTPPRRVAGKGFTATVAARTGGASGKKYQHTSIREYGIPLNAFGVDANNGAISGQVSATVDTYCKNVNSPTPVMYAKFWNGDDVSTTLTCTSHKQLMPDKNKLPCVVCYENHPNDSRLKEAKDVSPQLTARCGTGGGNLPLVQEVYPLNSMMIGGGVNANDSHPLGIGNVADPCPTIGALHHHAVVIAENTIERKVENGGTVRRLTPIEYERLMGFPDNYTRIPWKGKPAEKCPDSLRYKACSNSMCVNVMEWIGIRIDMVDKLLQK